MNSLATEAMGIASPLPLDTICPVLRSRTVVVMSAPALAASAVACLARASRPAKVAAGWSGGASGSGALAPIGATTVSCGPAGCRRRAVDLGFATDEEGGREGDDRIAVTNFDGRRRMALPYRSIPNPYFQPNGTVPTCVFSVGLVFPREHRRGSW